MQDTQAKNTRAERGNTIQLLLEMARNRYKKYNCTKKFMHAP